MITTVTLNLAVDKTLLLNEFNLGTVNRSTKMIKKAGGKGINVARVVNSFNKEVIATGFLGENERDIILDNLKEEEISNDFVSIGGNTRTCLAIIDNSKNISTEVFDPPPVIEIKEFEKMKQKLFKLSRKTDIVTINGSLPSGLSKTAYREIIEIITRRSQVFLDTSGLPLKEGIKANPYLIKPNLKEFQNLVGKKLENIEEITKALNTFTKKHKKLNIIIISLGSKGLIFSYNNEIFKINPIKDIEVINPVGSGDALIGGIGYKLDNGDDFLNSIKFGVACATSNLKHMSAGVINIDEISDFSKRIKINKLNI